MKHFIYSIFVLFLIPTRCLFSQTDTDFWFAVPEVTILHDDRPVVFHFASFTKTAEVEVRMPAKDSLIRKFTLAPNSNFQLEFSNPDFIENLPSKIEKKGVFIKSSVPIQAYYEVKGNSGSNTDIFSFKGKYALGTDFVIPAQELFINRGSVRSFHHIVIVASEDNTSISITPTAPTFPNGSSNQQVINLNKGETYCLRSFESEQDKRLAGTKITSNKPIAVTNSDDSVLGDVAFDLIGDQMIPFSNAGKKYFLPKGYIALASKEELSFTSSNGANRVLNTQNSFSTTFYNPTPVIQDFDKEVIVLFIDEFKSTSGDEFGGAILPPLACNGSNQITFIRNSYRPFFLNLLFRKEALQNFNLNGKKMIIPSSQVIDLDEIYSTAFFELDESLVEPLKNNRLINNKAPFHLAVTHGGFRTGYQVGFFSNFEIEVPDSLKLCKGAESIKELLGKNGFFGNPTIDTLSLINVNESIIKVEINDKYCQRTDEVHITELPAPVIPLPSYIEICQNIDSVLKLNFPLVIFEDILVQKTFKVNQDSIDVYVEDDNKCFNQMLIRANFLDSLYFNIPLDTSFCANKPLKLENLGTYDSLWINDQLFEDKIWKVDSANTFNIRGKNECQEKIITFKTNVNAVPVIDLGPDRELCANQDSLILPTGFRYLWQNGSTKNFFIVKKTDLYWARAISKVGECNAADSVRIVFKPFDSIPELINQKICDGQPFEIQLPEGHDEYIWQDGINSSKRTLDIGEYKVITNTTSNDTICYTNEQIFNVKTWDLTVPNIITPNGDGKNDTFEVVGLDSNFPTHLKLYSRWGNEIYNEENYIHQFDALKTPISDGVYFYEIENPNFDCVYFKGFLSIIR